MDLDFRAAIELLGGNAGIFRIANQMRPPATYLLNEILPERNVPTYHIDGGSMVVRTTMAGMVGMDSPYPPGGLVEVSTFLEQTAKFANQNQLNEATLRHMQYFLSQVRDAGGNTNEALANELLNFFDKVIMQAHFDRMEWLRGQALAYGQIDWNFNGKHLLVDYQVPASNFLTPRTVAGGDAYGEAGSVFWEDVRQLRRIVRNLRVILAHPDTIDVIRYNPANQMAVVGEAGGGVTFQRYVRNAAGDVLTGALSPVADDRITLVAYDREGEVINPSDPNSTLVVPFIDRGKLIAIGANGSPGYQVGQGSIEDDPDAGLEIGYTHIAPTVEGNGRAGRWGDMYTPEDRPWQVIGRGVTNGLPVIVAPHKIAVATTELS